MSGSDPHWLEVSASLLISILETQPLQESRKISKRLLFLRTPWVKKSQREGKPGDNFLVTFQMRRYVFPVLKYLAITCMVAITFHPNDHNLIMISM